MPAQNLRLLFSALCAAGFIAICVGLLFEIGRMRRGNSVLSPRQARWRIVGGTLWLLVIGSLAYATIFLWPAPGDKVMAQRWVSVVAGAMALLVVALIITMFDVYLTLKGAQLQRQKFERDAGEIAKAEIDRIRAEHDVQRGKTDGESQ